MELEVGMYVRTKYGISKIDEDRRIEYGIINPVIDILKKEAIFKASHNIIDLIEVGDLIEHKKIGIKQVQYKDKFNQYIWYSKKRNPLTCDLEDAITFEAFESEFEIGNISIVTKEQFESMSYKVGD